MVVQGQLGRQPEMQRFNHVTAAGSVPLLDSELPALVRSLLRRPARCHNASKPNTRARSPLATLALEVISKYRVSSASAFQAIHEPLCSRLSSRAPLPTRHPNALRPSRARFTSTTSSTWLSLSIHCLEECHQPDITRRQHQSYPPSPRNIRRPAYRDRRRHAPRNNAERLSKQQQREEL